MVVRFFSAGVAPSNTNTGRILWNRSLHSIPKLYMMTEQPVALYADQFPCVKSQLCAFLQASRCPPADPPEEAQQVGILDELAPLVPHRLDELEQPD
jgi:hypothetical protein